MAKYTEKIDLILNKRGVHDIDPFKGCHYGINSMYTNKNFGLFEVDYSNKNGCYGICYANSIAKFRGFDFSKSVKRLFINDKHIEKIGEKLKKIEFVRLGVSCDPSHDWEHTLKIIEKIKIYNKNIVVITKHWNNLTYKQCVRLKDIVVNTSISALDSDMQIDNRMFWYNKLKLFCKSVLRVNTANFNDIRLTEKQDKLLKNENVIDNVLRIPKNHILVKNSIVNVKKYKFLSGYTYASKHDENVFFGYCNDCKDKCGITDLQIQV
mgnify:CR=1 FL=1